MEWKPNVANDSLVCTINGDVLSVFKRNKNYVWSIHMKRGGHYLEAHSGKSFKNQSDCVSSVEEFYTCDLGN